MQVIARLILFTILTFWSLTANAQVRLLWRTALTNAPIGLAEGDYVTQTNYTVTGSAVDSAGNVVIAGFSLFQPGQGGTCSIMKFDPSGNRLWETVLSTNCMAGADDLAVDQQDRIVVSARLAPYPEVFSAKAMMDSEKRHATDRLEFELSQKHQALHQTLFWSASPVRFQEVGDSLLTEIHILNLFAEDFQKMFSFSRSRALRELKLRLNRCPQAVRNIETK